MNLKDLILKTRSFRRFDESVQVDIKTLENLIDYARLSSSGANRQPLKYLIYNEPADLRICMYHIIPCICRHATPSGSDDTLIL